MSNICRLRAERVQADAAALADAQAGLTATLARQADAQRVLDEIAREATVLEEVTRSLASRLDESRYALLGLCVDGLPDDILRCIFEAMVSDDDARVPFTLAAVCARWREVALASPTLWSTVFALSTRADGPSYTAADHARVTTLLSRSRAAPIDIIVQWSQYSSDTSAHEVNLFMDILGDLSGHASRWREVTMYPPPIVHLDTLEFLKGPTPLLEHLELFFQPGRMISPGPSERAYLPYAPNLRSLDLANIAIGCSALSAFPALHNLCFYPGACTDEALYDYLVRAPSLREVYVGTAITHPLRANITLLELQSLRIGSEARSLLYEPAATFLHTPKLSQLRLFCDPDDRMSSFFDAVSPTARILGTTQPLTSEGLSVLKRLKNVEELCLSQKPIAALNQLTSSDPLIWPRLSVLQEVGYTDRSGAHILRLIAARNIETRAASEEHGPQVAGTVQPCKLRELQFDAGYGNPEVPGWLVQEVKRLLRL
ncbi:hypothetical protein AURDEDRAFT_130547 [Auricularia subglabra TFB-10046 SS5]|nr:hypothetical protein AURDEDRAFT_130547 [Auricularia subglabra TFB-10046 SS5]